MTVLHMKKWVLRIIARTRDRVFAYQVCVKALSLVDAISRIGSIISETSYEQEVVAAWQDAEGVFKAKRRVA